MAVIYRCVLIKELQGAKEYSISFTLVEGANRGSKEITVSPAAAAEFQGGMYYDGNLVLQAGYVPPVKVAPVKVSTVKLQTPAK